MSKKSKYLDLIDDIVSMKEEGTGSRAIAKILGCSKSFVNESYNRYLAETNNQEDVQEASLSDETLGTLCEHPDWSVSNLAKRLRAAQRTNNQLRKVQREVFDSQVSVELVESIVQQIETKFDTLIPDFITVNPTTTKKTVEILFSDLQIGKISQFYNTEVAKRSIKYYGKKVSEIISKIQPERIIFASLGDITEDHLKHGVQSAVATDTSLAEQMADAIVSVFNDVLQPILSFGVPVEVICIAGNHGSSEHKGMDSFKAGRFAYDYTIYRSWEALCKTAGFNNVTFNIPEGCFGTVDIYGQTYLYEHGYTNGVGSEKQMLDHKKKRSENLKKYIHGFRCGDKHHSVAFDNSNLVCNGSFFGVEMQGAEYSGIAGFNSIPVQGVFVHEPVNGVGQSTICESHWIQIAKGY